MPGTLSVERMCRTAGVSRASFYRWLEPCMRSAEEMPLRAAIQQVVLEHRRRYGYRRVARELRRRGMIVNHKCVARLMREDNLLAVQPKAFVVTTDSDHPLEIYLNLAARLQVTAINQLWVADITYIRLASEFVYLAVVLDAFSRNVRQRRQRGAITVGTGETGIGTGPAQRRFDEVGGDPIRQNSGTGKEARQNRETIHPSGEGILAPTGSYG